MSDEGMKVNIKVGRMTIQFSAEDEKVLHEKMSYLGKLPEACGICKSGITPDHRLTKDGHHYYFLSCVGPKTHVLQCGQMKKGGLFIKGDWEDAQYGSKNDGPEEGDGPGY